jgi:hypothetical protein
MNDWQEALKNASTVGQIFDAWTKYLAWFRASCYRTDGVNVEQVAAQNFRLVLASFQ